MRAFVFFLFFLVSLSQIRVESSTGNDDLERQKLESRTAQSSTSKSNSDDIIQLPGKISNPVRGAKGSMLIGLIQDKSQLVIIDLRRREVVKAIDVNEPIVYAAGKTKLMIGFVRTKQLQRWSLQSFEREKTIRLDRDSTPIAAAMGCSSDK